MKSTLRSTPLALSLLTTLFGLSTGCSGSKPEAPAAALPQPSSVIEPLSTEALLSDFAADSVTAMNRIPVKTDPRTGLPRATLPRFSAEALRTGDFIAAKDATRRRIMAKGSLGQGNTPAGRAPFEDNDLAENLVDNSDDMIKTLEEMESRQLREAELPESPWSDTYWPLYQGTLAARYADDDFPADSRWDENHKYVNLDDKKFAAILASRQSSSIDSLSTAEKYDLMVGDMSTPLTQLMWNRGAEYAAGNNGVVEEWMGICHGWAPASFMLDRPTQAVKIIAADGRTPITFYPSDIKALGSLLWAEAGPASRFIGGRCDDKKPKKDTNGRLTSPECFDNNPGTWHQAVVNQIGVSHRGMVLDATYDYEVWNQPVLGYSYTYFNPVLMKPVEKLEEARVALTAYEKDKFHDYRSKEAVAVVGIVMDLTYIAETQPTHSPIDSPDLDASSRVRYVYDLELDAKGRIVGGEWYQNAHPDFLWTPDSQAHAMTHADRFASGAWDIAKPVPETWRKAAAISSPTGAPLGKIVEALIKASHVEK